MTEPPHTYTAYVPRDPDPGVPGPRTSFEPALDSPSTAHGLTAPDDISGLTEVPDPRFTGLTNDHPERLPEGEHADLEAEIAYFLDTVEQPLYSDSRGGLAGARHRKDRPLERIKQNPDLSWRRALSAFSVTLTALIVVLVSLLGAQASYPPLYDLARDTAPPGVAHAWPLLIYAPWLAATLSILRTRAYRRRSVHSWLVVLFFAAVASLLCVAAAPATPAGVAVAGLPPVTALLCFHQLVRQLDLTAAGPTASRHARPARGTHRHRPVR
ncbi:DUF2637 domain-containing protein [Streptomyces axinellae]|uniref:DUF2637 domain-containing protein n=1 Tax=Streptomyces axinellae TaxID=552788 RepID=A0ABN3Q9B1_9ACTN